ncbi:MAG: tetratricopeptide repeat protein, partial [Bacteroidota bacterium]
LLVLDNANGREDLSLQYRELRRSPNLHILITSRVTSLSEIPVHSIKAFDDEQAYQLFTRYYADVQQEEKELLYAIFQAVGHNTLVIELLAKNLKKLNRNKKRYRLEDLLYDLQNRRLLSLTGSKEVETDYASTLKLKGKIKPKTIIGGMYEILHLTDKQKKLLAIFSVLPAEVIPFSRLEAMIPDMEVLEDDLEALVEEGWLEEDKTSYKISPVIQEVVRKKHENIYEDCKGLVSGLSDLLDYETGTGHFINCSYKEAAEIIPLAQEAIKRIHTVDLNLSILVERVGNYYKTTGNLEKALGYFEEDAQLSKDLYDSYPENVSFKNGLAISYEKLGDTHSSLGNLEKALGYFEQEYELKQDLYDSYPENVRFKNGLAISYSKLARIHSKMDNKDIAKEYFVKCKVMWEELSQKFPAYKEFHSNLEWVNKQI